MSDNDTLRVVVFQDGDKWVAQCLEYDIGAQADDTDTLQTLFEVVLKAEFAESMARHGEPFAGIPKAPERFERMWDKRSHAFVGEPAPVTANHRNLRYDLALVA